MYKTFGVLVVFLAVFVQLAPAAYCTLGSLRWYCTFSCCLDYYGCCYNYWYAWTGVSLFFLFCLCACAGFGGYRYRRRYYYTTTQAPVATTVVTSANTSAYQPAPPQGSAYQPYTAPPPYNPTTGKPTYH